MSFEWQTDAEYGRGENPEPPKPQAPKRRRWVRFVWIAVLLGTAVLIVYRQLNERIARATDTVSADLRASYAVLQQAATHEDDNLLNSLLSGRDPAWATAQRHNLVADQLFNRTGFGLTWQPALAETAVFSQTLSPDLRAAELSTVQTYSLNIGHGLSQTVQLQRVDVFRQGPDRWLVAPPEGEFWGELGRLDGQMLSVRYPARDRELVQRLAADLEARLVQLCSLPDTDCPSRTHVRVIFTTGPESLNQSTFLEALTRPREGRPGDILSGQRAVVLPAPTLVGLPLDEAGYAALFRGYAAQLLLPVMNDGTGWECCANVPFYRAVMTYRLFELGISQWPLAETAVSLPDSLTLYEGAPYWNSPFPEIGTSFAEAPIPYTIVDFLINELGISSGEMADGLSAVRTESLGQWLVSLTGPPWTEARLNDAYKTYVAGLRGEPVASSEPDYGLMLYCRDSTDFSSGFYYFDYDLEAPQLVAETNDQETLFFTQLPQGSGVAVTARAAGRQPETYFLGNDFDRVEVTWNDVEGVTSRPPLAVPTITDPNGRYLLWTVDSDFVTGTFYALTDLNTCRAGSCEAVSLGGFPVWSPDSERLISLTVTRPWWSEGLTNGMMVIRQPASGPAINSPGFGSSIFWQNNERFGYLTLWQNGAQQVAISDVNLSPPRVILDDETLRQALPADVRPPALFIQLIRQLPTNPRIFVILGTNPQAENAPAYLIWYDQVVSRIDRLDVLTSAEITPEVGLRLSPDGRFLLFLWSESGSDVTQLILQDVKNPALLAYRLQGRTPLPRHFYASWSPDGEWLAMPELGYLRLWRDGQEERLLALDNLHCTNAAWITKMDS